MRVYRASSLGYSLEALVAPHLGYAAVDPPEVIQRAYDEGNRLESEIVSAINDQWFDVTDQQLEVNLEVIPGLATVQGHLDGIVVPGGIANYPHVLEIKTMAHKMFCAVDKKGWNAGGLMEKYKWQVSAYQLATGLPSVLVAWDKEKKDMCFTYNTEPFYTISDIANKLQAAEDAINAGELPSGCEDWPCPYYYLHESKDAVPVESADEELEGILAAWLEADKAEKVYKKEKDSLRAQILALAGNEPGIGKIKGACGVSVNTMWIEEKKVEYVSKGHWETRIQGPKNGR